MVDLVAGFVIVVFLWILGDIAWDAYDRLHERLTYWRKRRNRCGT